MGLAPFPGKADESQVTVSAVEPGVRPYVLKVQAAGKPLAEMKGTLLATKSQTTFFKWPTNTDPRKDLEGYRKLAQGHTAVSAELEELSLRYGMRGPSELGISDKVTAAKLGQDHFVEHFQIDGYAVLEFSLSPQAKPGPAKQTGRQE